MTALSNMAILLAQDLSEWYEIVAVVVVLVLLAVSGMLRRTVEKKQQQEAAERRRQEAARQRAPGQQQEAARRQQPQGLRREPVVLEEDVSRRQYPAQAQRRAARQPPAARPVPLEPPPLVLERTAQPHGLGEGVEAETWRQQQRLRQEEQRRAARLRARRPPEADSAAIAQRLVHVRTADAQVSDAQPRRQALQLRTPQQARRAIIFHEIFSAPKALRQEPEMWDR